MAGSGMSSVSISILDTATNKSSLAVAHLGNARRAQPVSILEVDEGGFTHMRINLTALSTPSSAVLDTPVLCQFNTIQFKDLSNTGLRLVLDKIMLLPAGAVEIAAAPVLQERSMVKVLADDQEDLKSAPNRYIMKLDPDTTLEDIAHICQELAGNVAEARFKGHCHTPQTAVSCRPTAKCAGSSRTCGV
jgi:hypothetical protein